MSVAPERQNSIWTIDSLYLHFQRQLDQQHEAIGAAIDKAEKDLTTKADDLRRETQAALNASSAAIKKAEKASSERFASVNEFRGQLGDQVQTFLPRTEYDANHTALIDKVEDEAKRTAERLAEVNRRLDLAQGAQAAAQRLVAVGLVAATVVISIIVFLANYVFGTK